MGQLLSHITGKNHYTRFPATSDLPINLKFCAKAGKVYRSAALNCNFLPKHPPAEFESALMAIKSLREISEPFNLQINRFMKIVQRNRKDALILKIFFDVVYQMNEMRDHPNQSEMLNIDQGMEILNDAFFELAKFQDQKRSNDEGKYHTVTDKYILEHKDKDFIYGLLSKDQQHQLKIRANSHPLL